MRGSETAAPVWKCGGSRDGWLGGKVLAGARSCFFFREGDPGKPLATLLGTERWQQEILRGSCARVETSRWAAGRVSRSKKVFSRASVPWGLKAQLAQGSNPFSGVMLRSPYSQALPSSFSKEKDPSLKIKIIKLEDQILFLTT